MQRTLSLSLATAPGVAVALFVSLSLQAQAPATPTQPAQQQPPGLTYTGDAGLVTAVIKPDKTADFEMVIGKLKEAFQKSENPERKKQAEGWKVFKSTTPGPNGAGLYYFFIHPVVPNADYTVGKILFEVWPNESQELYKVYREAFVGQQPLNLQLIASMSSAPPSAARD